MKRNWKGMRIKVSRNFSKFYHYVECLMKVWEEKSSAYKISVWMNVRSREKNSKFSVLIKLG